MGKKNKQARLKLPKRLLGVKIPKTARKRIDALLKGLPPATAKPLLGAAVASLVAALVARLEQPLQELIESHARKPEAPGTAH